MMIIQKCSHHPTMDFAAEELKKYIRMMVPTMGEISIVTGDLPASNALEEEIFYLLLDPENKVMSDNPSLPCLA